MEKIKPILPLLFIPCLLFFSTARGLRAGDKLPAPTSTPKPIDPGKAGRAREFFDMGNQYAERGLMDRAHEYWKIAAGLDPKLSEDGSGSDSSLSGQQYISDKTFHTGDVGKQKKISALLSAARKADGENDFNSAMKYLTSADDLSPGEPQVRALRVKITLEDFKADEDGSTNPIAKNYFDEAADHYRHGKFEEALQSINQAEELVPKNQQVLNLKIIIQEADSGALLSKEVLRAKEQWNEGNPEIATEILGNVLKKDSQFQPALDLRAEMGESREKDLQAEVHAALAQAAKEEKEDHFADAKKNYEKALGLDPKNATASSGLARVAGLVDPLPEKIKGLEKTLAAGEKRKAQAFLKEIEALSPDNPKLGHWKEQVAELNGNSVDETDESKADEAYNLGLESYRKGNLADAKNFWSQALELNPQHLQAQRNLDRLLNEHPELK